MTTHIYYAYKRDGVINENTICLTPKMAEQAARVHCVNSIHDHPNPEQLNKSPNAWEHMKQTGRIEMVALYCRERRVT